MEPGYAYVLAPSSVGALRGVRAVGAVCAGDADFACIAVCAWLVLGSAVVLAFVLGLAAWNPVLAVCELGMGLLTGFLLVISLFLVPVCRG